MTCDRSQEVSAYHDGELPAETARELEQHLAQCAACGVELAALRRLSQQVQAARLDEPPAGALQLWMRRSHRAADDRSVRRLAGWMTAAAAALLVTATLSLQMSPAEASPTLSEWELAMINPDADAAPQSVFLAQWMAADLSSDGERGRP